MNILSFNIINNHDIKIILIHTLFNGLRIAEIAEKRAWNML